MASCSASDTGKLSPDKSLIPVVRAILTQLASTECADRRRAIKDFFILPSEPKEVRKSLISTFERELEAAPERVQPKGALLLGSLKKVQEFNFEEWVGKWLAPALAAPEVERPRKFREAKRGLLKIAKNKSNDPFLRSIALGTMAYLVDQYGDPSGQAERMGVPITEWKKTLIDLLRDPDPDLALMVAVGITSRVSFGGVDRSLLVPMLIEGLRHDDFQIRWDAQLALEEVTGQVFCIDPTDPLSVRASGIQQWERWWRTTRGKP